MALPFYTKNPWPRLLFCVVVTQIILRASGQGGENDACYKLFDSSKDDQDFGDNIFNFTSADGDDTDYFYNMPNRPDNNDGPRSDKRRPRPSALPDDLPQYGSCMFNPNEPFKTMTEDCAEICQDRSSCRVNPKGMYCFCETNPFPMFSLLLRFSCLSLALNSSEKIEQPSTLPEPLPTRREQEACEEQCMGAPACREGGPTYNGYMCPVPSTLKNAVPTYVCACHNFAGGCVRRVRRERSMFKVCHEVCGRQGRDSVTPCRMTNVRRWRNPYCVCDNGRAPSPPRDSQYECSTGELEEDAGCAEFCREIRPTEQGPFDTGVSCRAKSKRGDRYRFCACHKLERPPVPKPEEMFKNWPFKRKPSIRRYNSWPKDNKWWTWVYAPKSVKEVVTIANWAMENRWKLRPSGKQHGWSPLTLPDRGIGVGVRHYNGTSQKYLLLKTKHLNRMGIGSTVPGDFSFWVQPGITLDKVLKKLEENGMGILHHPAPGTLTMGGIVAIGGHGTAAPAKGEKLSPGHTYGSVSNLIMSLTAVVYDKEKGRFRTKKFDRSGHEISAFLVNLGRTFITNMTMRAGPLQTVRLQSYFNIPANELFASPKEIRKNDANLYNPPMRTVQHFLDASGRLETILFPSSSKPWLKVWTVVDKQHPVRKCKIYNPFLGVTCSRKVHKPYPFVIADHSSQIPGLERNLKRLQQSGKPEITSILGPALWKLAKVTTSIHMDLWGRSKNVFLYVKSSSLSYHANGYAIVTSRDRVQKVVHLSYEIYKKMVEKYAVCKTYPVNGPYEVRITGVDDPNDVGIKGARPPSISATRPISAVEGEHPEFDTVVWIDTFVYGETDFSFHYMNDVEKRFQEAVQEGWAEFRAEWSKGFAYYNCEDSAAPWQDEDFIRNVIFNGFDNGEGWEYFRKVTGKYDPARVFSNSFLDKYFELYSPADPDHPLIKAFE